MTINGGFVLLIVSVPHTGTGFARYMFHRLSCRTQGEHWVMTDHLEDVAGDVFYGHPTGTGKMKRMGELAEQSPPVVIPLRDPLTVEITHRDRGQDHDLRCWDRLEWFRRFDPIYIPVDRLNMAPVDSETREWGASAKAAFAEQDIDFFRPNQWPLTELAVIAKRFPWYAQAWWVKYAFCEG